MTRNRLLLAVASLFLLGVAACDGGSPGPIEAGGTLALPLRTTGPDGARYHLRDAIFTITGASGLSTTVSSETDLSASAITVELPAGFYQVTLSGAWRMERTVDAGTTVVLATLVSPATQSVTVVSSQTRQVRYLFRVAGEDVEFAPGTLEIGIDIIIACDPIAQTGCPTGGKCTHVPDATGSALGQTLCAVSGTVAEGGSCAAVAGADDCAAGLFCLNGTCQRICAMTGNLPGCVCTRFSGVFDDIDGVGVCQPTCDVLAQDCGGGHGCYLNPSSGQGAGICAMPFTPNGAGTQGEACTFVNGCGIGYGCTSAGEQAASAACAQFCNAAGSTGPTCPTGAGLTCVGLASLYPEVAIDARYGFCMDCTQFPSLPACQ